MVAMIGTSDQPCWLAQACKPLLPVLTYEPVIPAARHMGHMILMQISADSQEARAQVCDLLCLCPVSVGLRANLFLKWPTCYSEEIQACPKQISKIAKLCTSAGTGAYRWMGGWVGWIDG